MADEQPFEMPKLRDLVQKNVEQARTVYGQFMDAMAQTLTALSIAPSNVMTSEFKAIQQRAIQLAKENAAAAFALAGDLSRTKDIQDVLALQSRFAQTQMNSCALQAQELGRLMADVAHRMKPKG